MRIAGSRPIVLREMTEHAVFWRDSAAPGAVFGGGVAVERGRLRLRGSDGRSRIVETVPAAELAAVAPGDDSEPIGDYPSLRLDLRGGRSIVLAAVLGTAALVELIDTVLPLLPPG